MADLEMLKFLTSYFPAGGFLVFLAWQYINRPQVEDPGQRILDAIADLSERVAKIEGYLEGKK